MTEREYTFPLMVEVISETGTPDEIEQVKEVLFTLAAEENFCVTHNRAPTPEELEAYKPVYAAAFRDGLLRGTW